MQPKKQSTFFSTNLIRKLYLDFFASKNHLVLESASLVPINDKSLLWINSGIATLKDYFSGKEIAPRNILTSSQRCIRTNDIDNVGNTSRHHTFFEMLGNFSIGGYFKKEAIEYAYEFIFNVLHLDKNRIFITVYDEDEFAYEKWISLGIDKTHIIKNGKDRNFWEIGSGPCGPCTEIYYDRGEKYDFDKLGFKLLEQDIENDRYIEIWNLVFSEFYNDGNNNYIKLKQKNIDTGAGLERLACILQDVNTNFDTDLYVNIRKILLANTTYKFDDQLYFQTNKDSFKKFINKGFNVIIDHFKAVFFAISDGVIPDNKERGYVLRKLLRRAYFYWYFFGIKPEVFKSVIEQINTDNKDFYPQLSPSINKAVEIFKDEYEKFIKAYNNAFNILVELVKQNKLDAYKLFDLVQTHGFAYEIINEIRNCKERELLEKIFKALSGIELDVTALLKIDWIKFDDYFIKHQEVSKSNQNVIALENQNNALMDLKLDSIFDYDTLHINDAKVIKLFDENFNEINELQSQKGFVILDKTCLFATKGGQIYDTGYIGNNFVSEVFLSPQMYHVHLINNATLKLNETYEVRTEKHRRNLVAKNHSAEHLLHSGLKLVLGEEVKQEGTWKKPEGFSFDFKYKDKLTTDKVIHIENFIKDVINKKIPRQLFKCSLEEAKKMNAIAYFEDAYKKIGGILRVIKFDKYSTEICGGTHVLNTSEIEDFCIINIINKGSGSYRFECLSSFETIQAFKDHTYNPILNETKNWVKELKANRVESEVLKAIEKEIDSNTDLHFLDLKKMHYEVNNLMMVLKHKQKKQAINEKVLNLKNQIFNEFDETKKVINLEFKQLENEVANNLVLQLVNTKKETLFVCINEIQKDTFNLVIGINDVFAKAKQIDLNVLKTSFFSRYDSRIGGKFNYMQGVVKNLNKQDLINALEDVVR